MANTKDWEVNALLDGAGKSGSELTHGLSKLGKGKMADGLVELWKAGHKSGFVKGAAVTGLAFSVAIGSYILIKHAIEDRRTKNALRKIEISATTSPSEASTVDGKVCTTSANENDSEE